MPYRAIDAGARFLFALSFAFAALSTSAAELDLRQDLGSEVRLYLSRDNFAELEKLHNQAMESQERLPSGVWKLFFVHWHMLGYIRHDADPAYWKMLQDKAAAWRIQFPNSSAAIIFTSYVHREHAWTERGTGLANQVRDWGAVETFAGDARDWLLSGGQRARANPAWYPAMIEALRLAPDGRKQFGDVVIEGMTRHPGYHYLYFSAASNLQPKWGGSEEAIEALAQEATNRSASLEGRAMYARIYWWMDESVYRGRIFSDSRADWPRMRDGFEDMVARSPDPTNFNKYAYFACLAGDKASMKSALRRLGGKIDYGYWGVDAKVRFDRCVGNLPPENSQPEKKTSAVGVG